jgi:hypothetical protein
MVRILPHELHINDPDFYLLLNRSTPGIYKCPTYYNASIAALVTSEDHKIHHPWRVAIHPLYSVTEADQW